MQLFITEYKKNKNTIIIADTDLLSQLRKVLRTSIGDIIWIQSPKDEDKKIRYELRIEVWDNKIVEGTIISEQIHESSGKKRSLIVAMPNKWDKIELIVQKLTECGLDQILFRPSERSVIKEWNPKKEERLHKIIKEAVEQSRGRTMPELIFTTTPKDIVGNSPLIVFDKQTTPPLIPPHFMERETPLSKHWRGTGGEVTMITGLIGPEGGLTYRDYQTFEGTTYDIYGLGETVLRTETATIIGGRIIKNNFIF